MHPHTKNKPDRYTFRDFEKQFPDDAACLDWLVGYLYPKGIECKICKCVRPHHAMTTRKSYACDYCGHHVHPTADTIFHKSSTPLKTWFHAMFLMASTRCGISAKQVERETGVTYKTAWRMCSQIRSMLDEDDPIQLTGKVEMDETYYGGKRKGGAGRPMAGDKKKKPIFGMVERKGRVVARATPDVRSGTLLKLVRTHVLPESTIFTDELSAYDGLKHMQNKGFKHRRIKHSSKVYVMGDIHTNTIEGFWSLVKRGIGGVYHAVSQKHLQKYLDEYSFRYNHRKSGQPMFKTFLNQIGTA